MAVLARSKAPADEVHRVISTALDGAFYRAVNPDLAESGLDPIGHYATSGWREGRDPTPWFSTRAYVEAYPEVVKAGWNPLHHYLTVGRREGREVVRSSLADDYLLRRARRGEEPAWSFETLAGGGQAADAVAEEAAVRHRERLLAGKEFDAAYYLAANVDVAKTGVDPLDHFLASGRREGRDPNGAFSVKDYLESYPDIASADINPFVHYLSAGRAEGRTGRTELGFRYEIIKRLIPLETKVAAVARASARLKLGTAAALGKGLAGARTGLADLHITFSHDDYTANTGGVQLCLQRESARIAALGRDHLHLHPAKPWPVVRVRGEDGHLGVLLNGEALGVFAPKTVAAALAKAASAKKAGKRSFAIHSLLGHNAGETADIVAAAGLTAGYFWLHDFASLCAGFHLLRNDVEDCSAPPPESAACGICVYGPWRARHVAEHERLFERLSLTVVSPAQTTMDLWKASSAFPAAGEVILPHAQLVERGPAPSVPADRPLRIAYAGMPAAHKGWEVFRDLAARHDDDPRYHFLHLGGRAPVGSPIEFHKVTVTDDAPGAMQDAISKHEADVVLIWPLCRETFSFTAYEAVAAGAAVIAGPDSGNVAAFVEATGHGLVMTDEDALAAAFETGDIAALARARRRPKLYDLAFSALTVDLLEGRTLKVLCYSSFTFSYLNRARVLFQTLRRFHPEWELVALITDRPPAGFRFDPAREPFDRVVWAEDLGIPDFQSWLFRHDVVEVCTAVKGPFIHQACESGADAVIYLDPDTALFASLAPLEAWLEDQDILLTPHLIDPNDTAEAIADNDLSASRTGIFNLGFVAIRTTGEGARFAKWWNDRLLDWCYDDMPAGLFVDQRWCDHVPALFDKVKVVRDPGYNVASWNLSTRTVAVQKDGQVTVNGAPLRFWHFTKLGSMGDAMTRKYGGTNFPVYEVWSWYKRQVTEATDKAIPERWWAYGAYSDGTAIEKAHRVLYRQRRDLQMAFPDPFRAGEGGYQQWLEREGLSAARLDRLRPAPETTPMAKTAETRPTDVAQKAAAVAKTVAGLRADLALAHGLAHEAQVREALTRTELTLALGEALKARAEAVASSRRAAASGLAARIGQVPKTPGLTWQRIQLRLGLAGEARLIAASGLWRGDDASEISAYVRRSVDPTAAPRTLFDQDWYLAANPESVGFGRSPLVHYIARGAAMDATPHPLFDSTFYRRRNAAELGEVSPLAHFLHVGAWQARDPHRLFDVAYYASQRPDFAPDEDPVSHYLRQGWRDGLSPHPLFDPAWYRRQTSGRAAEIAPLVHYVTAGWREGLSPHPLFDSRWYLEQYEDIAAAGFEPLAHFLGGGAAEGRNPSPWFDLPHYVAARGAARDPAVNPLVDYLEGGAWAVSEARPGFPTAAYLAQNPELVAQGMTPLEHWARKAARP